jgi:hypothetical protein
MQHPCLATLAPRLRTIVGDPGQRTVIDERAIDRKRQRLVEAQHDRPARREGCGGGTACQIGTARQQRLRLRCGNRNDDEVRLRDR